MKLSFWSIGKSHDPLLKAAIEEFTSRVNRYYPVKWQIIPPVKNSGSLSGSDLKKKEAGAVLSLLTKDDFLVALDEYGKEWSSKQLSEFIQVRANESTRQIVFLIGGAYGLDESVLQSAQFRWSLSALTFPHHLVRLILAEQVYRACTIGRNEGYHHE
ncbi:MAG TPA: 23S rRNA (pseudouridine(1915)-N(3))-methyltransferase RlmH [Flavitalea sp.]|nr:23S rRNA (pseudouridine(1915)-N(3))-methyltransferase RlmH [Flavitalea sp.]